ncbi:MAG: hypothetical protein QXY18_05500 [Nitrososphaerota archaeon]
MVEMRIKEDMTDMIPLIVIIIGLVAIGIIAILLIRFQRGLLGFILTALAVTLLIFWLKEIQKTIKEEIAQPLSKTKWIYDVIDYGTEITIIAEVPGPENKVKVSLIDHDLEILGGQGFRKLVKIYEEVEIMETIYRNGILQVKLKRKVSAKGS